MNPALSPQDPARDRTEFFTERLHLRRPVGGDAAAIIAIVGDWEVARRLARVPHPYGAPDFRFFLEQVVPTEPTWAMVLQRTRELVGVIGLAPHPERRSADLGYYVHRCYWGQGLATEAGGAIVRLGIERMGLLKLTARYHADNPASGRVLEKLGFKTIGLSQGACLAEGQDKASIDVELLGCAYNRDARGWVSLEFREARMQDRWQATHPGEPIPVEVGRLKGRECLLDSRRVGHCLGDSTSGEIVALAVVPAYQGRGIGRKLLALVVEDLRAAGARRIWAETPSNPAVRAHGFYRAVGWVPTGEPCGDDSELLELRMDFPAAATAISGAMR